MLRAFAQVESASKVGALGDKKRAKKVSKDERHKYVFQGKWAYKSWGLYQFQYDRWIECGGRAADWGHAGKAEQDRVMKLALEMYNSDRGRVDYVRWVATFHNSGHGKNVETGYVKKIRQALQRA
jgi:hypothetical protein